MYFVAEEVNGTEICRWDAQPSVDDCRHEIEGWSHKLSKGTVLSIYTTTGDVVDRIDNDELQTRLQCDFRVC